MDRSRRDQVRHRIAIICCAIAIGVVALWPLDFSLEFARGFSSRVAGLGTSVLPEGRDVFLNLALFMPLGAMMRRSGATNVTASLLIAFALSCSIELLQVFQASRIISLVDIGLNTGGASVGYVAHAGLTRLAQLQREGGAIAWARTVVAFVAVLGLHALMQHLYVGFAGWRPEYPLVIGNEASGDRPWCGRVTQLTIGDGARSWADDELGFQPADFTEDCPAHPSRVAARGTQAFTDAVRRSGQFTLAATIISSNATQAGPARIITMSEDPEHRNFTIGQAGEDLVLRLRRRWSGTNGMRPYYRIAGVFASTTPLTITVLADRTRTVLSVNSTVIRHELELSRDWWILVLPQWHWRPLGFGPLLAIPYWLLILALPVLLLGSALAGRRESVSPYLAGGGLGLATALGAQVLTGPPGVAGTTVIVAVATTGTALAHRWTRGPR